MISEAQATVELRQAEYNVAVAAKTVADGNFTEAQTALASANSIRAYLQMMHTNQGC